MTLKRKVDFEILDRIEGKLDIANNTLAVTCEKVARHDKVLFGNGQPGLVKEHEKLITDISVLKSEIKNDTQRQTRNLSLIITLVGNAISVFIQKIWK